jgi:hypothetical protein
VPAAAHNPNTGRSWGSTAAERELELPCDRYVPEPVDAYWRAVDVDAPPAVVFRWLCQLRVAPYSYDLIDNAGKRSPRELTPGLEQLETGQRVMRIFELVEFERGRHLTLLLRSAPRGFGELAVSYVVRPAEAGGSRLLVKLVLGAYPPWPARAAFAAGAAPWLELVMMRKQLLTLKRLAEAGGR